MQDEPIVALSGVRKTYGGVTALETLSLDVAPGEFVTLLGPSGCGKTTTLRLIAGFETADTGSVRIAGEDVTRLPPYRRAVNTVFQDYALFPHMTVAENVGYGLSVKANAVPRAERANRVRDALAMVDLADYGPRMPSQLSGGQRQRVAMARALVRQPKVLLLDEPLSALDVKLRQSMQVELKHLHEKLGITFVMVTHDQEEALVLSDRVVVMRKGRIVQAGAPRDLYDRPATPYIADFIGAANLIDATVEAISGDRATIRFADGSVLDGMATPGLAAGKACVVGIRPERLQPIAGGNGLSVTIVDHLFHGGSVGVEARASFSDRPIFMTVQRSSVGAGSDLPAPGTTVTVAPRDAADAIAYPPEDAS